MRIIEDPIYGAGFMLQIGGSLETLIKVYLKRIGSNAQSEVKDNQRIRGHFCGVDWHKGGAIWLRDLRSVATVVHEAFHATYHIMRHMDIKLDDNSEEAYTYYLEWLINQILKGEKRGTSIRNIRRKRT